MFWFSCVRLDLFLPVLFKSFTANIWEGRAPSRPIIWDDRDVVPSRSLFTYGVGLTAGTSFFCEPGATLEVIGATASSAAAFSFVKAPASTFAALMVYVIATFAPTFNS